MRYPTDLSNRGPRLGRTFDNPMPVDPLDWWPGKPPRKPGDYRPPKKGRTRYVPPKYRNPKPGAYVPPQYRPSPGDYRKPSDRYKPKAPRPLPVAPSTPAGVPKALPRIATVPKVAYNAGKLLRAASKFHPWLRAGDALLSVLQYAPWAMPEPGTPGVPASWSPPSSVWIQRCKIGDGSHHRKASFDTGLSCNTATSDIPTSASPLATIDVAGLRYIQFGNVNALPPPAQRMNRLEIWYRATQAPAGQQFTRDPGTPATPAVPGKAVPLQTPTVPELHPWLDPLQVPATAFNLPTPTAPPFVLVPARGNAPTPEGSHMGNNPPRDNSTPPDPSINPDTGTPWTPGRPPKRTFERKRQPGWPVKALSAAQNLAGGLLDTKGRVDAVAAAIEGNPCKGLGMGDKITCIWNNREDIDPIKMIRNLAANELTEMAIGRLDGALNKGGVGMGLNTGASSGYVKRKLVR